ncbi:alpha/beta fold hydrolase [Streptomyces parvulus]|nr:alpha/beta hydrolase [Streptomyces parvulus]
MVDNVAAKADVGGLALAYVETGAGEPLLLLHGAESHKGQHQLLTPHLSSAIRAIAYDQRDVGGSDSATRDYDIADLAADCVGLMDALGLPDAHLAGFSFGGAIALQVALRHPACVRSLVVGATPRSFASPSPFVARALAQPPEERAVLMRDASISPRAQQDERLMAVVGDLLRGRVTTPGSRRSAAITTHHLTAAELGSITAPTLLVYGAEDPVVPIAEGRALLAALPHAELSVIDDARHGVALEYPERVAALVSDWVSRHR